MVHCVKRLSYPIVAILILLSMVFSCGCGLLPSEMGGDFIDVTINATAQVSGYYYGLKGELLQAALPGMEVRFDFTKGGGQDFTLYRTTGSDGKTDVAVVGYNLHKGGKIEVKATVTSPYYPGDSNGPPLTWKVDTDTQILTFDTADNVAWSDSISNTRKYTWAPVLTLHRRYIK